MFSNSLYNIISETIYEYRLFIRKKTSAGTTYHSSNNIILQQHHFHKKRFASLSPIVLNICERDNVTIERNTQLAVKCLLNKFLTIETYPQVTPWFMVQTKPFWILKRIRKNCLNQNNKSQTKSIKGIVVPFCLVFVYAYISLILFRLNDHFSMWFNEC